jgi:hypothetical protein
MAYYPTLEKGTTVKFIKKPNNKEYDIAVGDIGVITYVASSGKYSIHIDGKQNPHEDAYKPHRLYGEDGDFWIPFECVKAYKFKKNDRVQILSSTSKYRGQYGTVAYDANHCYVKVHIDGRDNESPIEYSQTSLKLIKNDTYESEEFKMAKLTGFKRVAVIEMSGTNYYYALFDEDINVKDTVLVTGSASNKILSIKEILTTEEAKEKCEKDITAEVMCKVDLSTYNKRVENRKKAEELRKEMDKKIAEMDVMNKYTMYAERNPELAKMLETYRELVD